ncbi:hypothetical protein LTR17_001893 [Elasticomyces elasticus]|nr:hypothetical protein LTR17_001893 [Elasticomyces elasticus]
MSNIVEKQGAVQHVEAYKTDGATALKHAGDIKLLDAAGNIRRVPIASTDPNDPLNFSKWRKLGILVCCCFFSIFSLVLIGGLGPILPVFIELYAPQGYSIQSIVNLTTYPSLVMACGSFVILPLAIMYGRRPVFLGCCALLLGSTIGAAMSKSFATHMACRILQGFATGATESVLPLIITDMSFIDERGFWFGLYWGSQSVINAVFLISVSYLVAATNWRWFYWLLTILVAFGSVLGFFLLAETRYERSPSSLDGQVSYTDEFGVTVVLSDEEAIERFGTRQESQDNTTEPEQFSYLHHIKPFHKATPNALRVGAGVLWKMLQACSSPAVIWSILAASISLGIGIAMSLCYGTILVESFHWSHASVGLVNAGIFPAALLSMLWAGYIGDKIVLWLAKRRDGTHIPEDILAVLIVPTIVSAVGIIVFAVTAMWPETHSSWGIIMGWTLLEFGFLVAIITTTHFASEAYPSNPGSALVMVIGVKNVVSFGAAYGLTPMVTKFGYLDAFMILFAIFAFIFLMGVPVYYINPRWRAYISRSS